MGRLPPPRLGRGPHLDSHPPRVSHARGSPSAPRIVCGKAQLSPSLRTSYTRSTSRHPAADQEPHHAAGLPVITRLGLLRQIPHRTEEHPPPQPDSPTTGGRPSTSPRRNPQGSGEIPPHTGEEVREGPGGALPSREADEAPEEEGRPGRGDRIRVATAGQGAGTGSDGHFRRLAQGRRKQRRVVAVGTGQHPGRVSFPACRDRTESAWKPLLRRGLW